MGNQIPYHIAKGQMGGGKTKQTWLEAKAKQEAIAAKKAQHKENWSYKPKYTPTVDWSEYGVTSFQEKPIIWFSLDEEIMSEDSSAHALATINAWIDTFKTSPLKTQQKYGTLSYQKDPVKVFPIQGSYTIPSKDYGPLKVTIVDSPNVHEVVATVRIPVEAVMALDKVDVWLRTAVATAAQAAAASITTLDAFDRLLEDPAFRGTLKTMLHSYLQAHPDDALKLGLTRQLQAMSQQDL